MILIPDLQSGENVHGQFTATNLFDEGKARTQCAIPENKKEGKVETHAISCK